MDVADPASVEQDALCQRRLAAVNVGADADVAHMRQLLNIFGRHLWQTRHAARPDVLLRADPAQGAMHYRLCC